MNLQEFIKKHGNVNVNEKELKELLGIEDDKYFIPKDREEYWYVGPNGKVNDYINNSYFDVETYENSEVFKTEEEAEEHAKKQKFLLKMKRDFLDNSDKLDWNSDTNQGKYYLRYAHVEKKVIIATCFNFQDFGFITTDRGWLEQYVKEYEEEIKKYYFEVEEKEVE